MTDPVTGCDGHGPPVDLENQPVIVEVRNVNKAYLRGSHIIPVLQEINFDIREGEFLALMGPSGSGKSTLLNLIAGIDKVDSGTIVIGGVDITALGETELAHWRATNVGFIFQFYNLIPVLTAFENVELPLQLTGLSRSERQRARGDGPERGQPRGPDGSLPLAALRRRAAAGGHRPGRRHGPHDPGGRRAHGGPGPRLGERDHVADGRLNRESGKTIIMVTHDPRAAEAAQVIRHLEKGSLNDAHS